MKVLYIQAKSKLKDLDGYGNVYIERDITVIEREQNKKLRRELYEKRDEGKAWFIIRGGKVRKVEGSDKEMKGNVNKTGYATRGMGQRWRGQRVGCNSGGIVGESSQRRSEEATEGIQDGDGMD